MPDVGAMTDAGQNYNNAVGDVLRFNAGGFGYDGTLKPIYDGSGSPTALEVSSVEVASSKQRTAAGSEAYGPGSLISVTAAGINNTAIGSLVLPVTTSGQGNTAVGSGAMGLNVTGSYNCAFGVRVLQVSTVDRNNGFGYGALFANTTGIRNCAFGDEALLSNVTGSYSCAFGSRALYNSAADGAVSNCAFGNYSLLSTVSGTSCSAFGESAMTLALGSYGTAVGASSFITMTSGPHNTAIGYSSGGVVTTGGYNVFLGSGTRARNTYTEYAIAIGYGAIADSNQMMIGAAGKILSMQFPSSAAGAGTNVEIVGSGATGVNTKGGNLAIRGGVKDGTGHPGSVIAAQPSALATTATSGFLYIPICAGTPTGVPEAIAGAVPLVFDTVAGKLWIYTGGVWAVPPTVDPI